MKEPFIVHSKNYTSKILQLEEGFFSLYRCHHWEKTSKQIDVFPYGWVLFIGEFPRGHIQFSKNNTFKLNPGPMAVYLPPQELIEWQVYPGQITWHAFLSTIPIPSAPNKPLYFPWNSDWSIRGLKDIHRIFSDLPECHIIRPSAGTCPVAQKTKSYLDSHFLQEISMTELAQSLNTPYSTMCHYFKRSYGLSPTQYRKKLRISHAAFLITREHHNATESCYQSGYNDYSTFKDGFINTFGVPPSDFSWNLPQTNF